MTIWLDVEDLFEYARAFARPSGIQRLSYEIYAALQATAPSRVGFLRHDLIADTMRVVAWSEVEALYRRMTQGTPAVSAPAAPAGPVPLMQTALARVPLLGGALRATMRRLPGELRQPLGEAARAQIGVVRDIARAARAVPRLMAERRGQRRERGAAPLPGEAPAVGQDLREVARPGDTLAVFGSPWSHPDYAGLLGRFRKVNGLQVAMLVYDLIPLLRPEFCDRGLVMLFSAFMRSCLPVADRLMAISEATASDVETWAAREGLRIAGRPVAIPIGTGFALPAAAAELPAGLSPGSYALFVSTIEARKNHVLAFRAWRRLLDEMPAEAVPQLVFAGRLGWMVADLLQQVSNADRFGGKLVIIENPDDAALAALYRGARFTLFPSLYEGWGLPVSESLAFGKVCLASNSTSVPEAGGGFCLYHDPDSVTDAVRLYRRAIEEPGLIASLEARIATEYRLVPWSTTAQAVIEGLG